MAATRSDLHDLNVERVSSSYAAATSSIGAQSSASERHAEMLGLDSESTLRSIASSTDPDGTIHTRYQQYFRGVPVWGEHVVVAEDSKRSEERRVGKECRSRWSPYH